MPPHAAELSLEFASMLRTKILIVVLLMIGGFGNARAQIMKTDFDRLWSRVDSLEAEGLPASALEHVDNILALARAESNEPQLLKALMYRSKFVATLNEDGANRIVDELRVELDRADGEARSILQSIFGEFLWRYYQANRHRYLDRTAVAGPPDTDDISTWDGRRIVAAALDQLVKSVADVDALASVSVERFAVLLLQNGRRDRDVRPTLFDFLAHRALDVFANSESGLTEPGRPFDFSDPAFLAPAAAFVALSIESPDSLSTEAAALRLYQKLLQIHLRDADPSALVVVDLERLTYVRSSGSVTDADALYAQRLAELEQRHASHAIKTDVTFARAEYVASLGRLYRPFEEEEQRWKLKEAHEICAGAVAEFPQSFGADNCRALQLSIEAKSVEYSVEEGVLPGEMFRVRLEYRNVQQVHVAAVRVTREETLRWQFLNWEDRNAFENDIVAREKIFMRAFDLRTDGDFQAHSTELPLPAMETGLYVLLVGSDPSFSNNEDARALQAFAVTRLGMVRKNPPGGEMELRILDRATGAAVAGATVTTWEINYRNRNRIPETRSTFRTGNDGIARVKEGNGSFLVTVRHGLDEIVSHEWHHSWRGGLYEDRTVSHFFTDRAIYRPGQTVYFKGILLEKSEDRYTVRAQATTEVSLFDVNGQEVASLELRSNRYGTVKGQFTAPTGALTGQMIIRDAHGSVSFSVEEYKRPRFEVVFDSVETEIELGDEVSVDGVVRAYSGAPVDGAEVRYRVVRKPIFRPWYFFMPWPGGSEAEIASGSVTADAEGRFVVDFVARPDDAMKPETNPTFRYEITASAADAAGETQSASYSVRVGYRSLILGIRGSQFVSNEDPKSFAIAAETVDGRPLPASGTVRITRLQSPIDLMRERLWARVDRHILAEDEFRKLFPLDVYANEDDRSTWPVSGVVDTRSFNTSESMEIDMRDARTWEPGTYRMELSAADTKGRPVTADVLFTVYSERTSQPPTPELFWLAPVKTAGEPGEVAQILVGSRASDLTVYVEVERRGAIVEKRRVDLSGVQRLLEFPIEETDRGNFAVHFVSARHGRAFVHTETIQVPYTDRELKLRLETFRDQLYPGQDEEWRIGITGSQGEPVVAELMATLYDASLDAFRPHDWRFDLYPGRRPALGWVEGDRWGTSTGQISGSGWYDTRSYRHRRFDQLNWFGLDRVIYQRFGPMPMMRMEDAVAMKAPVELDADMEAGEAVVVEAPGMGGDVEEPKPAPPVRTNFNETAFFFPDLETNAAGETILKFTVPEALTRWRMMAIAHTTDVRYGRVEAETVTRKDLMITANAPRFLRHGDRLEFAATVQNLSEETLSGTATLTLLETASMTARDRQFSNTDPDVDFTIAPGQSQGLRWSIAVPEDFDMITYRVVADAEQHQDGEQKPLPVLTNRMLVTESLPLPMRGPGTKQFTFEKLVENSSPTLRHHAVTLEYTPNPVWYAVQALPYMMEFPHECSEQIFARLYANSIASHIVEQNPRIRDIFRQWQELDSGALQSNLEKNTELKSLVLEETPWVRAAQDETERKRRIGVLFDFVRMADERERAVRQLVEVQYPYGAWPWFAGMAPSRYVTQHIVSGFGHLRKLEVMDPAKHQQLRAALVQAVRFLDEQIRDDYEKLLRSSVDLSKRHISYVQIHYLYTRSFFSEIPIGDDVRTAYDYYVQQARTFWLDNDFYARGMITLALHRLGDNDTPARIIKSLREFALTSEELGMYWKYEHGFFWYQAPIETQSLLIEAFDEVARDKQAVADMQLWLLKQKQTQDWKTTKATTEAVYALLMRGTRLIDMQGHVSIELGSETVDSRNAADAEPGTGYLLASWTGEEISQDLGRVTVTKTGEGPAWGALYWQYFEQLDRITPAETPLRIEKQMLRERITNAGPVLEEITKDAPLAPGDKLVSRVVIRVDRDMEYVHLKDMRAAGVEPINVLSMYRYQDGLGYYESTRDAATHFFIGYLPKGTYVFEHPVRVNLSGDFSSGITAIQSMYAPEFASHSEGVRVRVK